MTDDELIAKAIPETPHFLTRAEYDRLIALAKRGAAVQKWERPDTIKIVYCKGAEGNSLYANDFRIAGPKPWGGGSILYDWPKCDTENLLRSIRFPLSALENPTP